MSANLRMTADSDLATSAPFCQVLHSIAGEAVEGDTISLMSFNPIPEECRSAIIKGIGPGGDPYYRRTYLAYRKLRLDSTPGATALRTDVITHPISEGADFQEGLLSHAAVHGTGAMPPDGPVDEDEEEGSTSESSRGSDVLVIKDHTAGALLALAATAATVAAADAAADAVMVHGPDVAHHISADAVSDGGEGGSSATPAPLINMRLSPPSRRPITLIVTPLPSAQSATGK